MNSRHPVDAERRRHDTPRRRAASPPLWSDLAVPRARAIPVDSWWRPAQATVLHSLRTRLEGLTRREAAARLRRDGQNRLPSSTRPSLIRSIAKRLSNPLILVLLCASSISAFTGDAVSFGFIVVIVLMSIALDLAQEHRAGRAIEALRGTVALRVRAWRDGQPVEIPATELAAGDVVELSAGDLVPADGRVLSASHFFVDQASLTGEAWPIEKKPPLDTASADGEPLACAHAVFMGSSVVTGSARMLVCATGARTTYGRLAHSLAEPAAPTSFERGTRRFGILLARLTVALVLFVLLVNTLYHRPLLESFLFAVALAVGLTPELLPMIVSVTLARGAVRMAQGHVIVKRLSAVQDLGAMDVLCTDKTGTLTEARLRIEGVLDAEGGASTRVFELAWLNSHFETGLKSGLDDAILAHGTVDAAPWRKRDEVAFDFERRRVSVLLERDGIGLLIVKGAPEDVLRLSSGVDSAGGVRPLDDAARTRIASLFAAQSAQGLRLLAVASRRTGATTGVSASDERDLIFAGFVAFADPPKATTPAALASLAEHGVALKIVTGDNEAVTRHLCGVLGIPIIGVLNGPEISALHDPALRAAAARANLFCRVTPEQKSRVVRAVQADGHVVGYLGDGINDAPPLHVADVGISVDSGAEVAKQAADMVLLQHDLGVLRDGIREGRRTLVNVNKYLLMATSSNFGNMVSMAAAALFLPFLPMRPLQILLNNFMYDLSELPIPTDRVAEADLLAPRRWDTAFIRNFMLTFGPLSSLFDLLAFALFYKVLQTPVALFQTAWFVQSMATQVLIIFVIRSARSAWRDRPSALLALSSVAIVAVAVALPYLPWAPFFGFVPMPASVLGVVTALTLAYLVVTELAKRLFYRFDLSRRPRAEPALVHSAL